MIVNGDLISASLEKFTTALRPSAGIKGRKIWDTDLDLMLIDNGSAWVYLSPSALSSLGSVTVDGFVGETKMMHTFNGLIGAPRGWMSLISGAEVTETKYDLIHGSGTYVEDGISLSPLNGLWLPDMVDKYAVGANATAETGVSQMAPVGNSGHSANIEHTHGSSSHNHTWYNPDSNTTGKSYKSDGSSETNISSSTSPSSYGIVLDALSSTRHLYGYSEAGDLYTNNSSLTTDSQTGTTSNVQPESHLFIYIMKVI